MVHIVDLNNAGKALCGKGLWRVTPAPLNAEANCFECLQAGPSVGLAAWLREQELVADAPASTQTGRGVEWLLVFIFTMAGSALISVAVAIALETFF